MKKLLLTSVLLSSVLSISCSHDNDEDISQPFIQSVFQLNFAYMDNLGNDLLFNNIYLDNDNIHGDTPERGNITTIHSAKGSINDTVAKITLGVWRFFINEENHTFHPTFINLNASATLLCKAIDSTGIAKLSISFPTLFSGRTDEIECHYKIIQPHVSLVPRYSFFGTLEIEFDKILLNGQVTYLRKVDPETGNITDEITNKLSQGTLVINPIGK
jgi:hypothetical protein